MDRLMSHSAAAFIAAVLGDSAAGLEYWRAAVQLLCASHDAAAAEPRRYAAFLRTFAAQLEFSGRALLPEDMVADSGSDEPFLVECLRALHSTFHLRKDGDESAAAAADGRGPSLPPVVSADIRAQSALLVQRFLPGHRFGLVAADELPMVVLADDEYY